MSLLKNLLGFTFWATIGKFGLRLISPSGRTGLAAVTRRIPLFRFRHSCQAKSGMSRLPDWASSIIFSSRQARWRRLGTHLKARFPLGKPFLLIINHFCKDKALDV